ncbi:GntR family transcriptional regulator [Streptohalobacillus salinus]|uniref:GntR family transcriptional regulator n=1 Tax=Streptohalobacillus salinus TaxID=621096 RepID=A0A2V3WFH0_9BACI|nr:GntR family transcriptional regulator [Streptohalobacillus salinus]PXW92479.1 GntR family transcriptional regulator [Streptohalobacillus salinus]
MTELHINSEEFDKTLSRFREDIEKGVYPPNERLHPLYELATSYRVSRTTMEAVIEQLVEENMVTRRLGNGVFVNPKPMHSSGIEELGSVSDMIRSAGKEPGTQFVAAEVVKPSASDLTNFNSLDVQTLARVERVRTADGEPVVYCIDKVDQALVPIGSIHSEGSIFKLIENYTGKRIHYAKTYIEPIGFHETISAVLNCRPDQSLLLLRQMHYTEDHEPILYSANYFKSDAFQFHVLRQRSDNL